MNLTFKTKLRRNLAGLAAALLAASVVSACAQIPSSGPVKEGPEITEGIAGEFLYYSPSGPTDGDSQEEIIRGFINAGTAPQNDYSTAREYLASDLKGSWNPSESTLVQRGAMNFTSAGLNGMQVATGVQAEVRDQGQYQAKPEGYQRYLDFVLVRENGQWRISEAPNLTMVISPVFDVIFEPYSLYFFDRQNKYLVPDVRWFPSRASTTTLITKALLEGPAEWLSDGVVSAIPSGTNLAIDSVSIAGGVAQVDLTARALVADSPQQRRMRSQILATLTQVPGVSDILISIERAPQDIPIEPLPQQNQGVQFPIGIINNSLRQVSGNQALIRNSTYPLSKVAAKDFALDSSQTRLALRDEEGVWVTSLNSIGQPVELIDNRAGLLTPAFDAQGYLWLTTASSTSSLVAYGDAGDARQIDAGWLQGMKRKAISVSSDGSRLAVLEQRTSGNRVWVAVIVRDAKGQPERLGSPIEVTPAGAPAISITWDDPSSLAVLTQGLATQVPKIVRIGGLVRELPSVGDGVKILASPSDASIYILTSAGELLQNRNASWSLIKGGISAAHFAG